MASFVTINLPQQLYTGPFALCLVCLKLIVMFLQASDARTKGFHLQFESTKTRDFASRDVFSDGMYSRSLI